MAKISVIIPVYNVEKELPRCLDSLLAQSYRDWEAVCIDDGSKDGSSAILDSYASRDGRFKIVHKQNGGVSEARNVALEIASGDYLMFMDSDDFLHPQTMEICMKKAADGAELVAFTYNRSYRSRLILRHLLGIPEPKEIHYRQYDTANVDCQWTDDLFSWTTEYSDGRGTEDRKWAVKHCQPWRCLYSAERIGDLRFLKGIIYEDFPWWGQVLLRIRKAAIINLPLYYYYPNKGSYILSAKQDYRITSLHKAIEYAREYMAKNVDERQYRLWECNFLMPFQEKLEKKIKKYGA